MRTKSGRKLVAYVVREGRTAGAGRYFGDPPWGIDWLDSSAGACRFDSDRRPAAHARATALGGRVVALVEKRVSLDDLSCDICGLRIGSDRFVKRGQGVTHTTCGFIQPTKTSGAEPVEDGARSYSSRRETPEDDGAIVERVAEAIYNSFLVTGEEKPWSRMTLDAQKDWQVQARAAIGAMPVTAEVVRLREAIEAARKALEAVK